MGAGSRSDGAAGVSLHLYEPFPAGALTELPQAFDHVKTQPKAHKPELFPIAAQATAMRLSGWYGRYGMRQSKWKQCLPKWSLWEAESALHFPF